jgi:hypothetical protein
VSDSGETSVACCTENRGSPRPQPPIPSGNQNPDGGSENRGPSAAGGPSDLATPSESWAWLLAFGSRNSPPITHKTSKLSRRARRGFPSGVFRRKPPTACHPATTCPYRIEWFSPSLVRARTLARSVTRNGTENGTTTLARSVTRNGTENGAIGLGGPANERDLLGEQIGTPCSWRSWKTRISRLTTLGTGCADRSRRAVYKRLWLSGPTSLCGW